MGKQRIGLIGKIGKSVINRYALNSESGTGTWLIDPYFFLIEGITVCQRFLEIVDTTPQVKNIVHIQLKAEFGIGTHRVGTDQRIPLTIESQVNIGFS